MDEGLYTDLWHLFKGYTDKKSVEALAEKFVDLLADYGVSDAQMNELLGHDRYLDTAIEYYLDLDETDDTEESDDWE